MTMPVEQIMQIIALKKEGKTHEQIAGELDVLPCDISRVLFRHAPELRCKRPSARAVSDETIAEMQRLRDSGLTMKVVAQRFQVSIPTVFNYTKPRRRLLLQAEQEASIAEAAKVLAIYQGSIAPLSTFAKMTGRIPRRIPQLEMREESQ